jgi:hypothetical protein
MSTEKKPSRPDWAPRFLQSVALTGNIGTSAKVAAVDRKTIYNRRNRDPEFAAALADALEDACDEMEMEARRRGKDGVNEPVIHQGQVMGAWVMPDGTVVAKDTPGARLVPLTIKRYSDVLLIFMLKAHRPEKFRERYEHKHTGTAPGGAVEVKTESHVYTRSDPEFLAAVIGILAEHASSPEGATGAGDGAQVDRVHPT